MHPNTAFRGHPDVRNLSLAREVGFGTLAVNGPDGPLLSHVPFLVSDDGTLVELHLLKSNAVFRAIGDGVPAKIAITGPNGYVSPDWYGVPDQVPTWNYIAVHLTGRLTKQPPEALHDLLDRQSARFENRLLPKPPWTTDKMSPGVMARMMRAIAPVSLHITATDGTWKLNQNKPDAVRLAAADAMAQHDTGVDTATLAELMRAPPPQPESET